MLKYILMYLSKNIKQLGKYDIKILQIIQAENLRVRIIISYMIIWPLYL